ncbi:MAG TPA: ATP-binding protein [Patescibacteria group bacterium]|nr:ATP-binding protein [Patescibacteria group bacterium]
MSNPTLILIRGLPGSGKSYIAKALQESLGADNVVMLDPDATDYKSKEYLALSESLTAEGVDAKFHPYRFLRGRAYKGIETNRIIIWNQGFTNLDGFNKTVVNLQAYAADHGTTLPLLVVEVEVDPKIAKERVAKRAGQGGHDVNEENFARFINDYATFAGQGYDPLVLHGEDDVATSVAAIKKALEKL